MFVEALVIGALVGAVAYRLLVQKSRAFGAVSPSGNRESRGHLGSASPEEQEWALKQKLLRRIISVLDAEELREVTREEDKVNYIRQRLEEQALSVCADHHIACTPRRMKQLIQDVLDEMLGCGPIEALLRDPSITEIRVDGPRQVHIVQDGVSTQADRIFYDESHLARVVTRMAAPLGMDFTRQTPILAGYLKDDSLFDATMPPASPAGYRLIIRRAPQDITNWELAAELAARKTTIGARMDSAAKRIREH